MIQTAELNPAPSETALAHFLNLVTEVESRFIAQGLATQTTANETKKLFTTLSEDQRLIAVRDLTSTLAALNQLESSAVQESRESRQLHRFLAERGLRLRDLDFADLIEEGDVVEIYDPRAVQIYRNFTYLKYCPYSLTELLVHDWNTLFQRPTWVVDRLMSIMPTLFQKNAQTHAYEIPEYLISARMRQNANGMLFKMKYATPLLDNAGMTAAFITTGTVRFVPDLKVGLQVDFL